MTIRPGYGVERLHLSMTGDELVREYGAPFEKRRTGSFREYWLYPEVGFDCIVSRRSDRILSIFLYSRNSKTDQESFGQTEEQIQHIYGPPSMRGGGLPDGAGGFLDVWYSYDRGIGFSFGTDHRVKTVMIFTPKRTAKPKAAISHRISTPASGVAAFQLHIT